MKLRILDAASQDLVDGYRFYERQQVGLGDYFLDALFADIDSLILYAGIHAVFFGSFCRLLAKRFPFAVFYRIEEDEVRVYAVLDCRRNPAWIRAHLTQST